MPHPCDHRCDHEENRKKLCAPCGRKIILGKQKIDYFQITESSENLIQKFINANFSISDPKYPRSICCNCRKILSEHNANNFNRPFKTMPNYEDIYLPRETRSSDENEICHCYICLTARHKGSLDMKKKLKVGESLHSSPKIETKTGQFGSKNSKVTTLVPVVPKEQEKKVKKLCNLCFQEIGRGISHPCIKNIRTKKILVKNIVDLTNNLPQKQTEQVCSKLIEEKEKSSLLLTGKKENTLTLSTMGRKRLLNFKKSPEPITIPVESLHSYQVQSGSSGQQMKHLATFIRANAGRKSIPAHYSKQVAERARVLEDFYKYEILDFDIEKSEAQQKRPVVWCNAEEILDEVIQRRSLVGNYVVKIMADGGQGFFKVCMTILPEHYVSDPDLATEIVPVKKQKVNTLTSVHKLIMLCIVPHIKETYGNVKQLFELIKINDIPFKFVADFKLLLIINGQQTASATFPCPYCFVSCEKLKTRFELEDEEEDFVVKTYGDLRRDYNKFMSLGGSKKQAKLNHSTINLPLFNEPDDMPVIEKCIMPELHILQGLVNHIFWKGLVSLLGKEKALLWPQYLKLISKSYHGDSFEGNACRKMLKEPDFLLSHEICSHVGGPLALVPYVSAFKALDKIVHDCFSNQRLGGNLNAYLTDLKKSLAATAVTETLKVHVCLKHLEQSLEFLEQEEGFGIWSEQVGESIHREFLKFWNRRKLNNMMDPNYVVKLKEAVVDFSSKHI